MKRLLVAPLLLFFIVIPVLSQTPTEENDGLQEAMEKLARDAAKGYIGPITSGFGVNLNSGWFHRAPWATQFGFDFEFGVVAMATIFQEDNKFFSANGDFQFDFDQASALADQAYQQAGSPSFPPNLRDNIRDAILAQVFHVDFSGPTVVGRKTDSLKLSFPGKTITVNTSAGPQNINIPSENFTLPVTGVLEEAKALPLFAPQLTLGTIMGTQFTFRYLPEVKLDDKIGNLKYFGFGIQHNPLVWFGEDALPFEVALGYFTQTLKVGTLMEAKATAFGFNSSIRLGWGFLNITPYVGYMFESSNMSFRYDYTINGPGNIPVAQQVTFDAPGENNSRFTFGASVKILIVNVNADINLGKYKAISGGIMIII